MADVLPLSIAGARRRDLGEAAALLALPVLFLGLAVVYPLGMLIAQCAGDVDSPAAAWHTLRSGWIGKAVAFTLWQALMSGLLTMLCAFPVARILARYSVPGRRLVLSLSIVPFVLPSIVVAFAFVVVYGRSGYLGGLLAGLGFTGSLLYNRWAIVAAHVFFNLPFCVRLLVTYFGRIPLERYQAAALLDLSLAQTVRHIEIPALLRPILNTFLLTFTLSLSTFAIALVLGGTPDLSTTEVAVYQFLRYEFDLRSAAALSALQLLLTLTASLLLQGVAPEERDAQTVGPGGGGGGEMGSGPAPAAATTLYILYLLFVALPIAGLALDAVRSAWSATLDLAALGPLLARAFANSAALALPCAGLTILLSWLFSRGILLLAGQLPAAGHGLQQLSWLMLGISPTVLAFAWFLALRGSIQTYGVAYAAVLGVHVVSALPLGIRVVYPAALRHFLYAREPVALLAIPWWRNLAQIEARTLRVPLLLAGAVGFSFSFGEVAAVALVGHPDLETVPLAIYRLMGSYRFAEASLAAGLLAGLCGTASYVAERYRA